MRHIEGELQAIELELKLDLQLEQLGDLEEFVSNVGMVLGQEMVLKLGMVSLGRHYIHVGVRCIGSSQRHVAHHQRPSEESDIEEAQGDLPWILAMLDWSTLPNTSDWRGEPACVGQDSYRSELATVVESCFVRKEAS